MHVELSDHRRRDVHPGVRGERGCVLRRLGDLLQRDAVEASITAGKITFDATAAGACVTGLSGLAAPVCASYWNDGPAFPDACDSVFTGKIADGAACTNDFECTNAASICTTAKKCGAAPAGARLAPSDGGLGMHPKLALDAQF